MLANSLHFLDNILYRKMHPTWPKRPSFVILGLIVILTKLIPKCLSLKRKVVNVPPYVSDKTPEYGNISQTSVTRTEDIYNHLNEKEEQDGEDNYDHACAATGLTRGGCFDSDYSSMRDVDNGCGKSAKNGADNYFTLEKN